MSAIKKCGIEKCSQTHKFKTKTIYENVFENFSNDKFVCKQAVCLYSLFDFQIQIEG